MIKTVTGRNILIVEDNKSFAAEVAAYFRNRQNEVFCAETLKDAEAVIAANQLDAIFLDVILPDGDGINFLSKHEKLPPVIVVTTLGTDFNVVEGLTAGATDYVVKPCSPEVLEARLSLRLLPKPEAVISVNGIRIDLSERTATYDGKPLSLTGSEFNILYFFITHAGVFYTAAEIYEKVWHAQSLNTTTVKYHVSNLRKKMLNASKSCADLIMTEFGKGYAFKGGENEN